MLELKLILTEGEKEVIKWTGWVSFLTQDYWFTRCCKFDLHERDVTFWEDLELKVMECLRNTLDRRIQFYEDEFRKLSEQHLMPVWNFCNYFILKESMVFMFDMACLHEDSLREYDELELCYMETVNNETNKGTLEEWTMEMIKLFLQLLFKVHRSFEVASRGFSFIVSFSEALALHESILPFCLREVLVLTSCLVLVNATADHYRDGLLVPEIEKEYYRIRGELYSLCRAKFMRLAYLLGYDIERSPVNSASLSMLPWPKPAIWPSFPSDASPQVLVKEKTIFQATPRTNFGIQKKPLPLEPSSFLREANRRRASLSAGNMFDVSDDHSTFIDGFRSANALLQLQRPILHQ